MDLNTYKTMELERIIEMPVQKFDREIKDIDYKSLTFDECRQIVNTPPQVQDFLNKEMLPQNMFIYNSYKLFTFSIGKKLETPKYIYENKKGVCVQYALMAAGLLADNNYDPILLLMKGTFGHTVFVYKSDKGFGALGNTPMEDKYKSIEALVHGINEKYPLLKYKKYCLYNFRDHYKDSEWLIGKDVNLGKYPMFKGYKELKPILESQKL